MSPCLDPVFNLAGSLTSHHSVWGLPGGFVAVAKVLRVPSRVLSLLEEDEREKGRSPLAGDHLISAQGVLWEDL